MIVEMEPLSMGNLISATQTTFLPRYSSGPVRIPRSITHLRRFRFVLYSKKAAFQDFQGYAKPSRLLVAKEPELCTDSSLEKLFTSFKVRGSECLYRVKLQTSSIYGSGLSNLNAGILLCLIDENGDSILQRIPASLTKEPNQVEAKISDVLQFQRGSVDEFAFEGPKLQKIESLWISVESGQWRLGGISLMTTFPYQSTLDENGRKEAQYIGSEYKFEVEDTLLEPNSVTTDGTSKEESMREYANLKLSLLFYDALLILSGSSLASFSAGENAAFGFLTGGTIGFLYLLLLQRSVDGLPAPASKSIDKKGKLDKLFGRFKGPVSTLVLAFIFAAVAVKYGSGDDAVDLTPKELLFGMLGFLSCKVAVVLAAFKPMPMGLGENKSSGDGRLNNDGDDDGDEDGDDDDDDDDDEQEDIDMVQRLVPLTIISNRSRYEITYAGEIKEKPYLLQSGSNRLRLNQINRKWRS
ncbi:hypothetical protein Vadar_015485 [Vaccinium darrowii]|uniref:Uncharacterized protein n=1 Tax=Vaccinium darrowii TaxID=229202 RepID=A0ACB7XA82_9ERIC|nr:hypothetical protein Vadar_015485 [Vaccinium darrowii]